MSGMGMVWIERNDSLLVVISRELNLKIHMHTHKLAHKRTICYTEQYLKI